MPARERLAAHDHDPELTVAFSHVGSVRQHRGLRLPQMCHVNPTLRSAEAACTSEGRVNRVELKTATLAAAESVISLPLSPVLLPPTALS